MSTLMAEQRTVETNGWEDRHNMAVVASRKPFERAITDMLTDWKRYAEDHKLAYDAPISMDYFCGPAWVQIGQGIRALFNGELGRLDGGTLDKFYCEVLEENGFNDEGEVA